MNRNYARDNIILHLSFEFSLEVIKYAEIVEKHQKYIIARQLLRSATSIGANIREAQNAESKSDFIHKCKIAAKEIDETEYWLLLCKHAENYPKNDLLLEKLETISKITTKIISSLKKQSIVKSPIG